jgi:N-sulfoglucosamine sulfohydrolase
MLHRQDSRRGFLANLAAAPLVAQAPTQAPALPAKPLNILYLHSHDSGRYLSPYGHPVPTPNLRRLAADGVIFRRAFSAAPTCSPSRASLLTGQCAHQNGMLGLAHRGFSMTDYRRHIVHTLRNAGYRSVLAGLQHVADRPERIGYDQILHPATTQANDVAPQAVAFLNSKPSGPFFLDAGFFETHREYPQPSPEDDPRYIQPPAPIADTPATRADMAGFHSSARNLDRGIGQVLEALSRNGLAENTLVISTTDHGLAFPRMKCNLTDSGWGVSLILRGPGVYGGGKVCDAMVSHLDLFPTLCETLKIQPPAWLEGKSLLPLLDGGSKEIHDEVFAEVNYHASYEPARAVRTQRYKYIRRYGDRHSPVLPNCDDSPSKDLWLEHGWKQHTVPTEELYDLVFDPTEQSSLSAAVTSAPVLAEMRGRLDSWMKRTDDPLLRGPVAAPPGAKVNPVDGVSPREPVVDATARYV